MVSAQHLKLSISPRLSLTFQILDGKLGPSMVEPRWEISVIQKKKYVEYNKYHYNQSVQMLEALSVVNVALILLHSSLWIKIVLRDFFSTFVSDRDPLPP